MQLSRCAPAAQARRARPVTLSCSTSAYLGRSILPTRTLGEHAAAPMPEWLSFWWSGRRRGSGGGRNPSLPALPPLCCSCCYGCLLNLNAELAMPAGLPQLPARRAARRGDAQVRASFLGVGAPEAILVGVVALVVFGPKGLAQVRRHQELVAAGGRRGPACKSAALPLGLLCVPAGAAALCGWMCSTAASLRAAASYPVVRAPHGLPTLTGIALRRPRAWAPRCARLRPPFGRSLRCPRS